MSADFNVYAQLRLFLSILFLPLQIAILPHFILREEYRSATSFRIMFAIGLCECYQMVVMGICPYFQFIHFYGQMVERIMGALNESTLDILFVLNLLLSVNRLCIVIKMNVLNRFSDKESSREKWLYRILFLFTGVSFLLITLLFLSPHCGLYLDEEYTIWNYNMNLSWTSAVRDIEVYGYMGLPTICFLIYCAIVVLMKWNASKLLTSSQAIVVRKSHELRILVQSLIQFLAFIIPIVYGFSGWKISNKPLDNYGVTSVCTVLYCCLNPTLYLLLLPKLRHQVLSALQIGKGVQPTTAWNSVNNVPRNSTNVVPGKAMSAQNSSNVARPVSMRPFMSARNSPTIHARNGTNFVGQPLANIS